MFMNQVNEATTCPGNCRWKLTLKRSFVGFLGILRIPQQGSAAPAHVRPGGLAVDGDERVDLRGNGFEIVCCGIPCSSPGVF